MPGLNSRRRVATVCRRDLAELRKTPAAATIATLFGALAIGLAVGTWLLLRHVLGVVTASQSAATLAGVPGATTPIAAAANFAAPGANTRVVDEAIKKIVGGYLLENALYGITLLPYSLIVWVFAGVLVMREKLTGNLETLLATPLSLAELWMGKTLALSAASAIIGGGAGILGIIAAQVVVAAMLSRFVFLLSVPAIVAAFILNPLFFSGMCGLILIIALTMNADASLIASFLIGMGAMIGLPVAIGTGAISVGSWSFCLYQTGAAAILWAVVIAMVRGAKKEKVVLSTNE